MPDSEDPQAVHEAAQKDAHVAALQREREGYEIHGRTEDVAAVDAELKRLGVSRPAAHKGRETATTDRNEKR